MNAAEAENGRSLGLLSIVVPAYDEEGTIAELYRRLSTALDGIELEIVIVDDGSRDGTRKLLDGIAGEDDRVHVVVLSRNFGHQAALTAGLDHARGDAIVMMDADLQDPPELILEMIRRWRHGSDVVHAVRTRRSGEPWWRLLLIKAFYRLFGRMAMIESAGNTGDFRLVDRRALDALGAMPERNRFLRGMSVWIGFEQSTVTYERDPRFAGETKYPLRRLVRLALDAIVSFSLVPLRLATLLGLLVSAVAFLGIPVAIVLKLTGQFVPGITSLLLAVLLLGGIQLITVGVIGEYLGRVYDEVKRRPLYVVSERINVGEPGVPAIEAGASPERVPPL